MVQHGGMKRRKTTLALCAALALCAVLAAGCGATAPEAPIDETAGTLVAPEKSEYEGRIVINELMVKNRATLSDKSGAFPDWIELKNISDESVLLSGFTLADGEDEDASPLPELALAPGECALIYADGESGTEGEVHVGFSLSKDETVILRDALGATVDSAQCTADKADRALARTAEGEWEQARFATPGFDNSPAGYDAWQAAQSVPTGLIISEAVTANKSTLPQEQLGLCDWAEIKNNSAEIVALTGCCLSDDIDALDAWCFPDMALAPGESVIVICSSESGEADAGYLHAPFDLSASGERLYLSDGAGRILDYVYLHDIPAGGSMGRMDGENGWFYFAAPQPNRAKTGGARRVSAAPKSTAADGVYNDAEVVATSLVSDVEGAEIYYTLDGSYPTAQSARYTGKISMERTCVLRAIAVEPGALASEAATFSFIINEGHTLPVVSLVADDVQAFEHMYSAGRKGEELGGSIAFYSDEGGFTAPCGIDMHGETSLTLPKKNMGIHFRSRYGASEVEYDLFGGGVTSFKALVLRAGQDQTRSIIRSELLENLCLQYSDKVPAQRSEYCVLYVNGEYKGIYALMEKVNEAHYAALMGVTKESVTVTKAPAMPGSEYYESVLRFAMENDLTQPDAYARFCELVDIDNLIDWMIIEGYSANTDVSTGNIRYVRSTEGDGKWRFMLFDLDATLTSSGSIFANVLKPASTQNAVFITQLVQNAEFRERFLTRASEVLTTTLSNANVDAEIVRLTSLIASEVERDSTVRKTTTAAQWEGSVAELRDTITGRDWNSRCIAAIGQLMNLSEEEMQRYFYW